ncbi:MAG: hypothetical protein U1F30_07375 [Steroidobacteraceae bacterium]
MLGPWLVAALCCGCATQPPASAPAPIAVQSVRLTAADHYVDLRYRVLDPAAAQQALGPGVHPRLINEANGAVMAVPTTAKLGSLRQTQAVQRPGHTYFVMFVNSGGLRSGSRVTAELGSVRIRHLLIE